MGQSERREKMVEYIRERKHATVPELSRHFGLSEASIRHDLRILDEERRIQRFHGGARVAETSVYNRRRSEHRSEKVRIAERALEFIDDDDTVFLDTGSTIHLLAERLDDATHLTIITNSLPIADAVDGSTSKRLILIGGEYNHIEKCFVGMLTDTMMSTVYANKAFISADSVSVDQGVFSSGLTHVGYVQKVIAHSRLTVLLVDSSKFDRIGPVRIADVTDIDVVVTDSGAPDEIIRMLQEKGITVLVV